MSSSRSSSPSTIPFKFRRKSSSASTNDSFDDHTYGRENAVFSSPLPSSSPPLTPLHGTRGYEYPQWEHPNYLDDVGAVPYDQEDGFGDATPPWPCYTRDDKTSIAPHPLPSLMTKFAAQVLKNQTSSSFQSPLYASCRTTSYFYPDGESALADDDCEEHDLESMDIHVRETYFATSSERGRWLSSPIATRVRTQAITPRQGKSSPVRTAVDASPSAARVRRRITSPLADKEPSSSSSSEDHDEDVRFSSPLPPSSPLTSPMSNASFLPDDCEDDEVAVSCPALSNPNSCPSLGASDLNILPIAHTSPVGSMCSLSQFEFSDVVPGPKPSNSVHVSRSSSPCPGHVSMSIDVRLVSPSPPDANGSGLDAMLSSPLSMFDDLPLAEPVMPLSNTKNTPHSGQPASTPDRMMNIAFGSVSPCVDGALLVDAKHETPGAIGNQSPTNGVTKKRKELPTSRSDAPRKKKRPVVQLPTTPSKLREEERERKALVKGRGKESHVSDASEPPKKKSKPSDRSSHSDGRRTKPCQMGKTLRTSEPHSHSVIEVDCTAFRPPDRTSPDAAHTSLGPVDPAEAEFQASLTGMLIEALATSRATSMDSLALYLAVAQTHPHLAKERPKQEFQVLIATVLESGRARCGMFEKVDSSGGSRRKALESRWFYVPDRDEDRERASLISAIMPRQKRSETKKYKQYYYRPLGKISRWDPEDAP